MGLARLYWRTHPFSKVRESKLPTTKNKTHAVAQVLNCSIYWNSSVSYDEDDEPAGGDRLSVDDAAQIWLSHGKDEDYTFGYSEEDLEDALYG